MCVFNINKEFIGDIDCTDICYQAYLVINITHSFWSSASNETTITSRNRRIEHLILSILFKCFFFSSTHLSNWHSCVWHWTGRFQGSLCSYRGKCMLHFIYVTLNLLTDEYVSVSFSSSFSLNQSARELRVSPSFIPTRLSLSFSLTHTSHFHLTFNLLHLYNRKRRKKKLIVNSTQVTTIFMCFVCTFTAPRAPVNETRTPSAF